MNCHYFIIKTTIHTLFLKKISTPLQRQIYTTSSCELPQGRKTARVNGCSGAISDLPLFILSPSNNISQKHPYLLVFSKENVFL